MQAVSRRGRSLHRGGLLCRAVLVSALGLIEPAFSATLGSSGSEGTLPNRKAVVNAYSARPDFFDLKLSPAGTRLAAVAKLGRSVTTLVIWDLEADHAEPVFRVDVPLQVGVREYGWIDESNLVAWVAARDPNAGSPGSADASLSSGSSDSPQLSQSLEGDQIISGTYTYVAHVDVAKHKVTARKYLVAPTETALVRAPMSDGKSIMLAECFGRFISVPPELTFSSDSSSSDSSSTADPSSDGSGRTQVSRSTDHCLLKNWAPNQAAKKVAPELNGSLMTYFGSYQAERARAQGRRRNEDVFTGSWSSGQKRWDERILGTGELLPRQNVSAELDDPTFWNELYAEMPVAGEPAGRVVMTSASQTPVAVQVTRPGRRLVGLDPDVADMTARIFGAFPDRVVDLLSVSENRDTVLFAVSDRMDPGGYYLWRRGGREAIPLLPRYKRLPTKLLGTNLESGWTSGNTYVGVTRPTMETRKTGIVVLPELISDEAVLAAFSEFDWEVQWLAASAYGSGFSCVVAINTALQPDTVLEPYNKVQSIDGVSYLGRSYDSIASWQAVFGDDRESATPGNWRFSEYSDVLLAYQMYDPDIRPLAMQTDAIRSAIRKAGGASDLYAARTYTYDIDYWNSRLYLTTADFLAPAKKPRNKDSRGIVTLEEIPPKESQ